METQTIQLSQTEVVVVENPIFSACSTPSPPPSVKWVETVLEEPEEDEEDEQNKAQEDLARVFEDLPRQEMKDYAEVELDELNSHEQCDCAECTGEYLCFAGICYDQSCWDCVRRGDYYSREVGFDLADEF
jgi:hypothetical protein